MADRIQQRRDTAARWSQYNPILLEGEVGYVTDNPNQYKIGDGIHAWNDLPLRGYTGTISQEFGDDENSVVSQKTITEKVAELESKDGIISSKIGVSVNFVYGGILSSDGSFVDNKIRIRSSSIYSYVGENKIRLEHPNILLFNSIIAYQGEAFVKQIVSFSTKDNILSFTNDGTFDNVRITFKKDDESEISEDELNSTKAYNLLSIENDISSLYSVAFSSISSFFEYGGILSSDGSFVDNKIRIRSSSIYSYVGENKIRLEHPNILLFNSIIAYQGEAFVKQIVSFSTKDNILSFTNDGTFDNVRITFKKDDESEISEDELNSTKAYKSIENDIQSLKTSLEVLVPLEYGGISVFTGELVDNKIRIRTKPIYYKGVGLKSVSCTIPTSITIAYIYAYMGTLPVKNIANYSFYNNRISFERDDTFDNIRVSFSRTDSGEFTQDDIAKCRIATIFNPDYCYSAAQSIKYAALGDSITYGFIPRNYDGYPGQLNSYAKLAAEKLGMNFVNYGISGSTIANVSGRNPMSVRYADMVDDADIITVMGGTNDVRNGVSLGTMDDRTNDTFYGALHVLYQGLYDKYIGSVDTSIGKRKKVIVITPIKLLDSTKSTTENTVENNAVALEQWDDWIHAIKEVAAFYSFPVLDFYDISGINPHINRTVHGYEDGYTGYYNPYITDGTHPTQEGHEIMANVLVGFIKSLGIVE